MRRNDLEFFFQDSSRSPRRCIFQLLQDLHVSKSNSIYVSSTGLKLDLWWDRTHEQAPKWLCSTPRKLNFFFVGVDLVDCTWDDRRNENFKSKFLISIFISRKKNSKRWWLIEFSQTKRRYSFFRRTHRKLIPVSFPHHLCNSFLSASWNVHWVIYVPFVIESRRCRLCSRAVFPKQSGKEKCLYAKLERKSEISRNSR